jgi:predicted amidohydrolase
MRYNRRMRIGLCQIDTTVGDLAGNRALGTDAVRQASAQGARLCVLPELTLSGYPPRDLLDRPAFIEGNRRELEAMAAELPPEVAVLVGFVERAGTPARLYNAVALLEGGAVRQQSHFQPSKSDGNSTRTYCEESANRSGRLCLFGLN